MDTVLGDTSRQDFRAGNGSNYLSLYFLWLITVFNLMIHLMNMLVGIMAIAFDDQREITE